MTWKNNSVCWLLPNAYGVFHFPLVICDRMHLLPSEPPLCIHLCPSRQSTSQHPWWFSLVFLCWGMSSSSAVSYELTNSSVHEDLFQYLISALTGQSHSSLNLCSAWAWTLGSNIRHWGRLRRLAMQKARDKTMSTGTLFLLKRWLRQVFPAGSSTAPVPACPGMVIRRFIRASRHGWKSLCPPLQSCLKSTQTCDILLLLHWFYFPSGNNI